MPRYLQAQMQVPRTAAINLGDQVRWQCPDDDIARTQEFGVQMWDVMCRDPAACQPGQCPLVSGNNEARGAGSGSLGNHAVMMTRKQDAPRLSILRLAQAVYDMPALWL